MKNKRSQRMSQGLTTYGIGAIVGIGDESFINTGVTQPDEQMHIDFPRLARRLRVHSLRFPKVSKRWTDQGQVNTGNQFSFMRFPSWMFCPSCRSMKRITPTISNELNGRVPLCDNHRCKGHLKSQLHPVRFVVACEHGHIDEFRWKYWAHSKRNIVEHGNCQENKLFYKATLGAGAGWDSLVVSCICGASRSMKGLEDPGALQAIGHRCNGKQPWQSHENSQECGQTPIVSQRNASNIYQPVIVSAIDIDTTPQAEEINPLETQIRNHNVFNDLLERYEASGIENHIVQTLILVVSQGCGCSQEEVIEVLSGHTNLEEDEPNSIGNNNIFELNLSLQEDEWPVFFEDRTSKKFVNKVESLNSNTDSPGVQHLTDLIGHVSLVKKLREIRAFKGFNRLQFDPGKIVPPSLDFIPTWLPAVEIYGEGIFIALNREKLDSWYNRNKGAIDDKTDAIMTRYLAKGYDDRFGPFSPKFVLLHTLSHLLIRQLAFESGYNAASLRENIYFSDKKDKKMAGILVYTADSDSEGSLGGLVRQGQWERLLPTILLALEKSTWCSSDPVCSESKGQGQDGLNQGACHACGLISETSCTHQNILLSRTLLIDKEIGFFKDIVY